MLVQCQYGEEFVPDQDVKRRQVIYLTAQILKTVRCCHGCHQLPCCDTWRCVVQADPLIVTHPNKDEIKYFERACSFKAKLQYSTRGRLAANTDDYARHCRLVTTT